MNGNNIATSPAMAAPQSPNLNFMKIWLETYTDLVSQRPGMSTNIDPIYGFPAPMLTVSLELALDQVASAFSDQQIITSFKRYLTSQQIRFKVNHFIIFLNGLSTHQKNAALTSLMEDQNFNYFTFIINNLLTCKDLAWYKKTLHNILEDLNPITKRKIILNLGNASIETKNQTLFNFFKLYPPQVAASGFITKVFRIFRPSLKNVELYERVNIINKLISAILDIKDDLYSEVQKDSTALEDIVLAQLTIHEDGSAGTPIVELEQQAKEVFHLDTPEKFMYFLTEVRKHPTGISEATSANNETVLGFDDTTNKISEIKLSEARPLPLPALAPHVPNHHG